VLKEAVVVRPESSMSGRELDKKAEGPATGELQHEDERAVRLLEARASAAGRTEIANG